MLLYGYMEYGPDFFSQLNGIYAAAIWDGARERLVLVLINVVEFAIIDNNILFFILPANHRLGASLHIPNGQTAVAETNLLL